MDFFSRLMIKAKKNKIKILSVACAEDSVVLKALEVVRNAGIVNCILVGDEKKIRGIAEEINIDINMYQIINIPDTIKAARKAVELVSTGKADVLMKGLVDTSIILKAVVDPKIGLRVPGNLISHIGIFNVDGCKRPLLITDSAININPTLEEKKKIIINAVSVMKKLGCEIPKVACLCAKEKVSEKMIATVHAAELQAMNERGEIKDCLIAGPIALDVAISQEAAKHKNYIHLVGGNADILMVPEIESGNILYKSIVYFSKSHSAGIVLGTSAPIVLTSRADSNETKVNSILLAISL
ncbi:MAG: bifunctional enoyl-CoA hydratase/phosphate acetyltransferase [Fusobacteriaceae bacterium]